jgi:hypothetical protein
MSTIEYFCETSIHPDRVTFTMTANNLPAIIVLASVLPGLCIPALAQSDTTQKEPTKFSRAMAAPCGYLGAVYGVMVGVPVRCVRYIKSESRRMSATLQSDIDVQPLSIPGAAAAAVGTAYGVASGTILGLVKGTERGILDGYQEPFSRKSIGLEDPPPASPQ